MVKIKSEIKYSPAWGLHSNSLSFFCSSFFSSRYDGEDAGRGVDHEKQRSAFAHRQGLWKSHWTGEIKTPNEWVSKRTKPLNSFSFFRLWRTTWKATRTATLRTCLLLWWRPLLSTTARRSSKPLRCGSTRQHLNWVGTCNFSDRVVFYCGSSGCRHHREHADWNLRLQIQQANQSLVRGLLGRWVSSAVTQQWCHRSHMRVMVGNMRVLKW